MLMRWMLFISVLKQSNPGWISDTAGQESVQDIEHLQSISELVDVSILFYNHQCWDCHFS